MTDDTTLYQAIEYIITKLNLNEHQQTKGTNAAKAPVEDKAEERRIIKGVRGLKEYLGIGLTKAQEIINSQILQKKVQYTAPSKLETILLKSMVIDPIRLLDIQMVHSTFITVLYIILHTIKIS